MVVRLRYIFFILFATSHLALAAENVKLYGVVTANGEGVVPYATIGVEGSVLGTHAALDGSYELELPHGVHKVVVTAVGYETLSMEIAVGEFNMVEKNFELQQVNEQLNDVVVVAAAGGVSRLRRSAFNVVAIDGSEHANSTRSLSDVVAKSPGVKVRETGGAGSDMNIMLDGFGGKHVKVFVDGVPQEGAGGSFAINGMPVDFAERVEVYRGVVPVLFGTDAMGGVINIVTNRRRAGWSVNASYSCGSFNTHKLFANFGKVYANGMVYELNAYSNSSDNNYMVDSPVEDFETGSIEKGRLYSVERFNDAYRNNAVLMKVGVMDKWWGSRLMLGVSYSNVYKEVQTGVRQEIVYGAKHRHGWSFVPSLEYAKNDLLLKGLDVVFTANYNRNSTTNVDTASCRYNWFGETKPLATPGEQTMQHMRSGSANWNTALSLDYRPGNSHTHHVAFNYVLAGFERSNSSLLLPQKAEDPVAKVTRKGVAGVSYRLMPSEAWNVTIFAKRYDIYASGPVATTGNADDYVRASRSRGHWGYGVAGTWFMLPSLQLKLSYENACRLPSVEELFGDEDLEQGDAGIKPEKSHNANLGLSYWAQLGAHGIYVEGGLVYRNTRDYIQRNIVDLGGGKSGAAYVNYGKVLTKGYNLSLRYSYGNLLSAGGNFTDMRVLDNMKSAMGSSVPNLGYGEVMPNVPSLFADFDATVYLHGVLGKGSVLSLGYDGTFVQEFCYYSAKIGANKGDYTVPDQLSHSISLACSMDEGRYNVALECRNVTDERLYDNFSLQKPGRAFYMKLRVRFDGE